MEAVLECCCGLDVHRDNVVACILKGTNEQKPEKTIKTFSSMPDGLKKLRSWLEEENCHHAAMESTGVYWQPVYNILEEAFDETMIVMVVNARHMRNVPGKKTDMKDAEWIAQLLRSGLLNASFIPSKSIRELRELTRYRKTMVEEVTSQKNRVEKFLQSTGFKLSTFCSDVFGVSGRAILEHLSRHGSISVSQVESLLKTSLRAKREEIALAASGSLTEIQQEFLSLLLRHLHQLEANVLEIDRKIDIVATKYDQQLEQLDGIPGIDKVAAQAVLAEIGTDMSKFKTAAHLCSWAGLSPGSNESAGKKKSVRVTKGNPYVKRIVCEIAWCVTHMRKTYLSSWYWKVKQRRGGKRAIVALARKILTIIYSILKNEANSYDEELYQVLQDRLLKHRQDKIIKELVNSGFVITPPARTA